MNYNEIRTTKDIEYFLETANDLHDGYVLSVQYANNGIIKTETGHQINPSQTKLSVNILVTSIYDTVVEMVFENILEWQIKVDQFDITETAIEFDDGGFVIWADGESADTDTRNDGSYVIARSLKWRIVND